MKKMSQILAISFLALFLLAGCGIKPPSNDTTRPVVQADLKKPRIPQSMDLKASVLDAGNKINPVASVEEMKAVLDQIDQDLNRPNITKEDIKRGWYAGGKDAKKYGTPDGWVFMVIGGESRWVSSNFLDESDEVAAKDICKETAGTYVLSCYESDKTDCQYIAQSECRCIDGSRWHEKQGCILMDMDGNYVLISAEDLARGWYLGLPNEKKLNTPGNWVWQEGKQDFRWQNPSPRN